MAASAFYWSERGADIIPAAGSSDTYNTDDPSCTFCGVINRRLPGRFVYEDDDIVVFRNQLDWVPVMLLVTPRRHMTQLDLWRSGDLLARVGNLAARLGEEHAPGGFRILSNFGYDGLQTQLHAHIHVIGGEFLGLYVRPGEAHP